MRALADAAAYFAPELEVLAFPAWDCLPYDRSSPSLRATSERLATLHALQRKATAPQLLVTTVNAATQRTLTPFRIRQLVARLAPGERIDLDRLTALLAANGYGRTETVRDPGEFAVRGGIVDLFPSGEEQALRLDFFGDEIESVRRFDPATQRSTDRIEGFTLLPASETLLDEESVRRFRSAIANCSAPVRPATRSTRQSPKGAASPASIIGCLCSRSGWPPCSTISPTRIWSCATPAMRAPPRAGSRPSPIITRTGSARRAAIPAATARSRPRASISPATNGRRSPPTGRSISSTPFHEPESATVVDFGVDAGPRFRAGTGAGLNVYEAVVAHVTELRRQKRKVVLASYSAGSRERLKGLLADHGLTRFDEADNWQEALGASAVALGPPLDHGFTTARGRPAHRAGHARRPARPPPQARKSGRRLPLRAGDAHPRRPRRPCRSRHRPLRGPDPDPGAARRRTIASRSICAAATSSTCRSRISTSSPATAARARACRSTARRRGLAAAQVADEGADPRDRRRLIRIAAERALRPGEVAEPDTSYAEFATASPMRRPRTRTAPSPTCSPTSAPASRWTGWSAATSASARPRSRCAPPSSWRWRQAGRVVVPTTLLARQHYKTFVERFQGFPIKSPALAPGPAKEAKPRPKGLADGRSTSSSAPTRCSASSVEFKRSRPRHRRRGAALRRQPQGAAEGAARRRARADADRDADPAHAADGAVGCASCRSSPRRRSTAWRCAPTSCAVGPGV
jgi:transcription-repair coupling factor (superfamily II helicase)